MSRDSLKIALVLSLAFNLAVIGAFVYGFVRSPAPECFVPPPPGAPADSFGGRCSHFARQIGLPRDKAARFSRLFTNSSDEMLELRGRLQEARTELVELISVPTPDEKMVMAKVDEISAIQGELEKRLITRLLSVNAILQPEERERLMYLIRCRCMPCPRDVPNGPKRAR
jgi:Spy/CpxP family protein refolding chaperone